MPSPDLILVVDDHRWPPDPLLSPHYYRGVTLRRVLAYCLDCWFLVLIVGGLYAVLWVLIISSLGLLWPLHFLLLPFIVVLPLLYHTLSLIGPAAATPGMRLFNLRVWSYNGGRPTIAQALVQTFVLYMTLGFSGGILLLIALFNPHRRTPHDFLAGTVVLREHPFCKQ